jgi:hypothetical protein
MKILVVYQGGPLDGHQKVSNDTKGDLIVPLDNDRYAWYKRTSKKGWAYPSSGKTNRIRAVSYQFSHVCLGSELEELK